MADSIQVADTIASAGHPLAFKVHQGTSRPAVMGLADGRNVFKVEARALGGHQKEAVVTEGQTGSAWRMVSDEGAGLGGTDLAPFPLGFMAAGLQADLAGRIEHVAAEAGRDVDAVRTSVATDYAFSGSFFKGTGRGSALAPDFRVALDPGLPRADALAIVERAAAVSPLLGAWRTPLANVFALYVNGRRRPLRALAEFGGADATDPLKAWGEAPRPLGARDEQADIIRKVTSTGATARAMATLPGESARLEIPIRANGRLARGIGRGETRIDKLGGSTFALVSDERPDHDSAPSGLAYACAGVAFCLMTQLLRYVDYHRMKVRALRVVQESPFAIVDGRGTADPFETHVFVHADESDETMERLLEMAAGTCYLHAALGAALEPRIRHIDD